MKIEAPVQNAYDSHRKARGYGGMISEFGLREDNLNLLEAEITYGKGKEHNTDKEH